MPFPSRVMGILCLLVFVNDIILLHFPLFISRLFVFALLLLLLSMMMMKRESEERRERVERDGLNSFSLCIMSNCKLRSNSKEEKGRICLLTGGRYV